ncbi:MAG TPA: site-2 protease family protein [Acidobacteriota bacterium]|nr:site-2 protease family protein [Acidobacteriota bacterium]
MPNTREWAISVLLFLLTLLSTTFAGLTYAGGDVGFIRTILFAASRPSILLYGLPFSVTFLTILLAHEFGHFFACQYYGIRCTPPYFIPVPISIAGTLGAFIRIRSHFKHKRALFDVGVAGPLAGFLFVIPALFIGIAHSRLIAKGAVQGGMNFGEPLIFRWVGRLVLGYSPATQDMIAHPIAMAAWFGLLATCLNLFPIWQLDGGHIAYAIFGRDTQRKLSIIAAALLILVSFAGWPLPSYLVFGLLLLGFGIRFRFYHPPTLSDEEDIGRGRIVIGALALLILVVSFTPVPISIA